MLINSPQKKKWHQSNRLWLLLSLPWLLSISCTQEVMSWIDFTSTLLDDNVWLTTGSNSPAALLVIECLALSVRCWIARPGSVATSKQYLGRTLGARQKSHCKALELSDIKWSLTVVNASMIFNMSMVCVWFISYSYRLMWFWYDSTIWKFLIHYLPWCYRATIWHRQGNHFPSRSLDDNRRLLDRPRWELLGEVPYRVLKEMDSIWVKDNHRISQIIKVLWH